MLEFSQPEDFQYVVHKPKKAKICFGSMQERDQASPVSRFSVAYTRETNENLFPGKYEQIRSKKITSLRGTVLGGRTADRKLSIRETEFPSPAAYRIPTKPPNVCSFGKLDRFPHVTKRPVVGPGYYEIPHGKKSLACHYSFGGKRTIIPPITLKCGSINTDLCEKCKTSPIGDYWTMEFNETVVFLCRACYEDERKFPKIFTKTQLRYFQKIRDCSQIHFHGGCEARILLKSPRMIDKITEKEAYLSLYFP